MCSSVSGLGYLNQLRQQNFSEYSSKADLSLGCAASTWGAHKVLSVLTFPANVLNVVIGSLVLGVCNIALFTLSLGNIPPQRVSDMAWLAKGIRIAYEEARWTVSEWGCDIRLFYETCIRGATAFQSIHVQGPEESKSTADASISTITTPHVLEDKDTQEEVKATQVASSANATQLSSNTNKFEARFFSCTEELTFEKSELLHWATDKFHIHRPDDTFAISAHRFASWLSAPWRYGLRTLFYAAEPLPGENKHCTYYGLARRVTALLASGMLLPLGAGILPLAVPFHIYSHKKRPFFSMIHNEKASFTPNRESNFSIRTHNLGFVYEFWRVFSNLRYTKTRADEIGQWVVDDAAPPEVIVFQEGSHDDGAQVLCEKLEEKYPYIIHSVAPHISGLNNGTIIASQHPIEEFSYRPFKQMNGPEGWTNGGLIKIRVQKEGQTLDVYTTHLKALPGAAESAMRLAQLQQIIHWIQSDQENNEADVAVLAGDLNASRVDNWGMLYPEDDAFFTLMEQYFIDIFAQDHNEMGERNKGESKFTVPPLEEPTGSWMIGPFADKGLIIYLRELYERVKYGPVERPQVKKVPKPHYWGTPNWHCHQHACSALLDLILRWKKDTFSQHQDWAEIRRVQVDPSVQSGSSDHAPMEGRIWVTAGGA